MTYYRDGLTLERECVDSWRMGSEDQWWWGSYYKSVGG